MWVGTLNVKEFVLLARNSVSPLSCPCLSLYVSYHYPAVLMSLNYCLFYSNNSNSWEIQYHKALMLKIYHEEPKMFLKILHNLTILVSHHKKELNQVTSEMFQTNKKSNCHDSIYKQLHLRIFINMFHLLVLRFQISDKISDSSQISDVKEGNIIFQYIPSLWNTLRHKEILWHLFQNGYQFFFQKPSSSFDITEFL